MAKFTSPSYTPSSDAQPASSPSQTPSSTPASIPNAPSTPVTNAPAPSSPSFSGANASDTSTFTKSDEKNEPVYTLEDEDSAGREYQAPIKKVSSGKTIKIKLLHGIPVKRDSEVYYVAVSAEGDLKGYLVKADAVENTKEVQTISVSDAIELYDWDAELKLVFSDIETVRRNALLSFWKAGALFETDKANPKVVQELFDSAYPYRMP